MNVPAVWFWVSGLFFFAGIFAFAASVVLLMKLAKAVDELKPKVDQLTERVNSIAEKVESTAASAKSTVESVGSGTRQMVGSLQGVVTGSAERLGKLSTYIVTAMTLIKLYREFSEIRAARQVDKHADEEG